jgi:hypothetical protein
VWTGSGNNVNGFFPPNANSSGQQYSTFFTQAIPGTILYNTFQKWIKYPGAKKFKVTGGGGLLGTNEGKIFTLVDSSNYFYNASVLSNNLAIAVSNDLNIPGNVATAIDTNTSPFDSSSFLPLQFELIYGDESYGQTAAIDRYTRKIGLFTRIESSSFLPKRNTVALKYLVDEFGGLTELNQQNNNWGDIQKMFLMSDTASVALFDNKKYGNQKSLDGQKLIFDSGYSYSPILYGSGVETSGKLYFDKVTTYNTYQSIASFVSSSYYISGSSTLGYPLLPSGFVSRIFNNTVEDNIPSNLDVQTGNYPSRSYSVTQGGGYNVDANVGLSITVPANVAGSLIYSLKIIKKTGGTFTTLQTSTGAATFIIPSTSYPGYSPVYCTPVGNYTDSSITITSQYSQLTSKRTMILSGVSYPAGWPFYVYTAAQIRRLYSTFDRNTCTLSNQISTTTGNFYLPSSPGTSQGSQINLLRRNCIGGSGGFTYEIGAVIYIIDDFDVTSGPQTKDISLSTVLSNSTFAANDKIQISLQQTSNTLSPNPTNYTSSISPSNSRLTITAQANIQGNYPYSLNSTSDTTYRWFADPDDILYPTVDSKTLVLHPNLSQFYSSDYQFIPTFNSGSTTFTASLYNSYGDIDYPFQLQTFDLFTAYDQSGSYFESRIIDISRNKNNYISIKLNDVIPGTIKDYLSVQIPNAVPYKFLFLKRVPDETNTYLSFQKRPGGTSYGFLIPNTLAPDVIKNIDTITSQVKQKLLADQQGTITQ